MGDGGNGGARRKGEGELWKWSEVPGLVHREFQ